MSVTDKKKWLVYVYLMPITNEDKFCQLVIKSCTVYPASEATLTKA